MSWSANDCVFWFVISKVCVCLGSWPDTQYSDLYIKYFGYLCVFLHIMKCIFERFSDIPVPLLSFHLRRCHLRFRGIEWFHPFSQSEVFLPQTQFVSLMTLDFYNLQPVIVCLSSPGRFSPCSLPYFSPPKHLKITSFQTRQAPLCFSHSVTGWNTLLICKNPFHYLSLGLKWSLHWTKDTSLTLYSNMSSRMRGCHILTT